MYSKLVSISFQRKLLQNKISRMQPVAIFLGPRKNNIRIDEISNHISRQSSKFLVRFVIFPLYDSQETFFGRGGLLF